MSDIGPGDLVVCVDARETSLGPSRLVLGRVYPVHAIIKSDAPSALHGPSDHGILLTEVACRTSHGFAPQRFRKFDEGDSARLSEKLGLNTPVEQGEMA